MPSDEWEEEVEVLESILGKEIVCYDEEHHELLIQCFTNLQNKSITVYNTMSFKEENNGEGKEEVFAQSLRYLAPILLICKPSKSYPSQDGLASLNLNCVWLSKLELKSVKNHLKSMWTAGDPVIYDMITWIQDNLLEHLDIYDEIHITDSSGEDYCCDALTRISILNQCNRDSTVRLFNTQSHDCCTCFCEFPGVELCLLTCLHPYCTDCITTLINVQFDSGRYCNMNCSLCDSFVGREIIEKFMDHAKFSTWEERFVMQSVEENSMILFCPRCKNYAVREEDNLGSCASCNFLFCDLCNNAWHPGQCESFDVQQVETSSSKYANEEAEAKRLMELQKNNEKLTQLMKKAFLKHCPRCKCWVMRDTGCNHMRCALCGTNFCYVCGGTLVGSYTCCGATVPQAPWDIGDLNNEQKEWAGVASEIPEIVANVIEPDAMDKEITKCPKCKGRIQRINENNHAKCLVCKIQFCFLCMSIIKGTGHFQLRGCRQHGGEIKR